MTSRISQCFADAAAKNRAVLGVFVTAGDPDEAISAALLDSLVENGADFVETGHALFRSNGRWAGYPGGQHSGH